MAEMWEADGRHGDLQTLLLGLKRTVEGLLANHSTNVWSIYGGLSRLCTAVEYILYHRLRINQQVEFGSKLDYWPFIQGLKWLNPTSTPTIDRLNRTCLATEDTSKGQVWLTESLHSHNLSSQLCILVTHHTHLTQYYYEDAFLCNGAYFQAMCLCLQAVELNTVSLLAEIDLSLITRHRKVKVSHVRSASLPINHLEIEDGLMMGRRKTSSHDVRALAPPFTSPKSTESLLAPSAQQALPINIASSPEYQMSAKDALLSVLEKSGGSSSSPLLDTSFNLFDCTGTDPLTNTVFLPSIQHENVRPHRSKPFKTSHTFKREKTHSASDRIDISKRKSDSMFSGSESIDERLSHSPDSGLTATSPDNLLDDILNCEDDEFDEERETFHPREISNASLSQGHASSKESNSSRNYNSSSKGKPRMHRKVVHRRVKSDVVYQVSADERHAATRNNNNSRMDDLSDQSDSTLVESTNMSASLPGPSTVYSDGELLGQADQSSSIVVGSSEGYFPKPSQGQSLMSYLSSQDFHTCASMDKENAHFSISEALIAAIEQMKWNHVIAPRSDSDNEDGDSDEEIQELKQRIRIRRRDRQNEKTWGYQLLSDGRTDTTSTSSLSSPPASTTHTDSDSSEEGVDDQELELSMSEDQQSSNLSALKDSGLSLSMASLYSDADIIRSNTIERQSSVLESTSSYMSAESVAISLLKKFSEKRLPKASDLEWLVSEQEAPQALLPLPDSYPISPDDGENSDLYKTAKRPRIRGNLEWAPPRAQIIFNIHPAKKRSVILSNQNNRCAGCGMKVEPGYVKRFRYCEYLGKYFCQCCHTNSLTYIPGRILQKWDFAKYSISIFSRDLLSKLFDDPLFNLQDVNPNLYRKVGALSSIRDYRTQLRHLKNIIRICKTVSSLYSDLEKLPPHWMDDSQLYSMADLLKVKSAEMQHVLKAYVQKASSHVADCPLCHGMGFICEFCNNAKDVIFPFQLHKVIKCHLCMACYHKTCFVPNKCPKCARIEARRQRLLMATPSPEQEQTSTPFGETNINQSTETENS